MCPLGIGREATEESLRLGRSAIGPITSFDPAGLPRPDRRRGQGFRSGSIRQAAEEPQGHGARFATRRRRVGSGLPRRRDRARRCDPGTVWVVVLGADSIGSTLATSEPSYRECLVDGVFRFERWADEGAAAAFPLNFLKVLPNMIASHISIAHDARGPNNTMHHGELSSLHALSEATSVIQRGAADVMLAGGASSQMNPFDWVRHCLISKLSPSQEPPHLVLKPFDLRRSGQVHSEGATVLVLERLEHALSRGAVPIAKITGQATAFAGDVPCRLSRESLIRAMTGALHDAGLRPCDVGHVNANGLSTANDDAVEAGAILAVLGDVPTIAPKSYFGNLGAATGTTEILATLLAIRDGAVPITLNYEHPDPACPVNVVAGEPLRRSAPDGSCPQCDRRRSGNRVDSHRTQLSGRRRGRAFSASLLRRSGPVRPAAARRRR